MRLRALNDSLVVRLEDDDWKYINKPNDILIPEAVIGGFKKKSQWAVIESIGSSCKGNFKKGDRIYFAWYDHRPGFIINGKDLRIIKEQEVLIHDRP